ncbi:MAG: exopolysaccharide biosynthesis protein [Devosia sp.]|uniref:polysaccharide biosynthesis/export family protein n=1 Tax=Devosia sp. TaxID=1871048 RepID=UPI002615E47F|nr:polysaccharide biosynthesis/export family protein [Devosia sp.]MDB5540194.1 exopolysaccharide biosynthesis protein [Devosia sp.]
MSPAWPNTHSVPASIPLRPPQTTSGRWWPGGGLKSPRPWLLAACLGVFACGVPAWAYDLSPQTKVRLTVIQWMPLKGLYERLDALSGELIVSDDGTIPVPVIGAVPAQGKTTEQVATDVANQLRTRLGLVDLPSTSLEVVEYPPLYVVGAVTTPGAFPFRPRMTVLQGYALAGGTPRDSADTPADRLRLVSELQSVESGLVRTRARIARIEGEMAGAKTIDFPPEVTDAADATLAKEVVTQETAIFIARSNELVRQAVALKELASLLNTEINTLHARISEVDMSIASSEKELAGVRSLVESGIATVSRQSTLEQAVANRRFDRVTQQTAILRAQQALNEAMREAARLQDVRSTENAQNLQTQQAQLEQFLRQQKMQQRLLLEMDSSPSAMPGALEPSYTIVRTIQSGVVQLAADETTELQPGDVLKVSAPSGSGGASGAAKLAE